MKKTLILFLILFGIQNLYGQYYFPSKTGNIWETTSPSSLGWCQDSIDSMYDFLNQGKTKGFIVLKNGKIVLEQYFNGHGRDSFWYWASAGKTVLSFLIGRAQEQGFLKITDSTSQHLGKGWTSLTAQQEAKITVKNQLCMNTGLDFTQADCTAPSCLKYWKDAGADWYYHNPPYTLLRNVLESATGKNINTYMLQELTSKTGISGSWFFASSNNILFSTTRSMARFGTLMLNNGIWEGNPVLGDTAYLKESVNTSQNINKSYGYLWWLNGKDSFRLPQSLITFHGSIMPDAPADVYAGIGKNGQYVCVVPSQNMVVIRIGEDPEDSPVPTSFINAIFKKLQNLSCANSVNNINASKTSLVIYPNPSKNGKVYFKTNSTSNLIIFNLEGKKITELNTTRMQNGIYSLGNLCAGIYLAQIDAKRIKFIVQ